MGGAGAAVRSLCVAALLAFACNKERRQPDPPDPLRSARERMVRSQIAIRGVADPRVLAAMRKVPRHEFVPQALRARAYEDRPLPIGEGQTISQPYIVAYMAELACIPREGRVLEIGTGSGYGAAVLAEIAAEVYTIEILEPLAHRAQEDLARTGYGRVHVRCGDGYRGWAEAAPFDAIILTAAPPQVPEPLKEQLRVGGVLVAPVGDEEQDLIVVTRTQEGFLVRRDLPVRFVPMTGESDRPASDRNGR